MDYLKENWKSSLAMLILLAGLGVGIHLVQTQQVFKGRATGDMVDNTFSVTDESGNPLNYQGNNTYQTGSLNVNIKIKDLAPLTQ